MCVDALLIHFKNEVLENEVSVNEVIKKDQKLIAEHRFDLIITSLHKK